ncbi:flavodoxin family protein [Bacillus infantis]|uniref:flavodoxin family protein n=1 Tax=Bacillus infantis TaxID=324767 RepID=UPI003CEE3853
MKTVNPAHDEYLVIYYSASGNTKKVAEIINEALTGEGKVSRLFSLPNPVTDLDIESYKHVFIGSPTYGNGTMPKQVRDLLRYIIKENEYKLPTFSVFGTGDTQWSSYCRTVDEMTHHLNKKTNVIKTLKMEQYPISDYQISNIVNFVKESIGGI